ncbi:hypothetical protein ILUMI_01109 [Ignelater luminosus]|uniref:Uncharacterized protein n=1 Tax=Ignelater luminosus TaxID=2038154 RepID=A0A8K0DIZ4_IGNLU|nr:hypothetical protein ILUMI_01109 [Ignelater luminosus]
MLEEISYSVHTVDNGHHPQKAAEGREKKGMNKKLDIGERANRTGTIKTYMIKNQAKEGNRVTPEKETRREIDIKLVRRQDVKNSIEEFMNKELEKNAPITASYRIGNKEERKLVIVEMEKWKDKHKIRERKHKLGVQKVFIKSELTDSGNKIQFRLGEIARSEKEQGILSKAWYKEKKSDPQQENIRILEAAANILLGDIRSQVYNNTVFSPPDNFLDDCNP